MLNWADRTLNCCRYLKDIDNRKMYGSVNEEDKRRWRSNNEIEQIRINENIMKFIKSQKIRWLDRIERLDEDIELPNL